MEHLTKLSLAELLIVLEDFENEISDDEEYSEVEHLQLCNLIGEIQSRCPLEPFRGLPWTIWDFYFNLHFLGELELEN
jgi:hypothetical protein